MRKNRKKTSCLLIAYVGICTTACCISRNHAVFDKQEILVSCPDIDQWPEDWEHVLQEKTTRIIETIGSDSEFNVVIYETDGATVWKYFIFPIPDEAARSKIASRLYYIQGFIRAGRARDVMSVDQESCEIVLTSATNISECRSVVHEYSVDQYRYIVLSCKILYIEPSNSDNKTSQITASMHKIANSLAIR
jgi:hypothetical protein